MEHYTDPIAARRPKRNLASPNKPAPSGSRQPEPDAVDPRGQEFSAAITSEPRPALKTTKSRAAADSGRTGAAVPSENKPPKGGSKSAAKAEKPERKKGETSGKSAGNERGAANKEPAHGGSKSANEAGGKSPPASGTKRKGSQPDESKPSPSKKLKQISNSASSPVKAGNELPSNGLEEAGNAKPAAGDAPTKRKAKPTANGAAAAGSQQTGLQPGPGAGPSANNSGATVANAVIPDLAARASTWADTGASSAGFNVPLGFLDTIFEQELKQQRDETQLKAELVATKLRVASDVDRIEKVLWGLLADLRNIKSICGIRT
eukprot:jgi/Mesvir1/28776/Mv09256-RA.1